MTKIVDVELTTNIGTEDKPVKKIGVRTPNSGELRGLNLTEIGQLKVDALISLLPRITVPPLTEAEIQNLPPCDLLTLGVKVADFLLPNP